jgi:hypothetical protein
MYAPPAGNRVIAHAKTFLARKAAGPMERTAGHGHVLSRDLIFILSHAALDTVWCLFNRLEPHNEQKKSYHFD